MTSSHPTPAPCQWFSWLAAALDRRSAPRLTFLFLGAILARRRRTVTTWIRAAKLSDRFQSCFIAVAAAGKRSDRVAGQLLTEEELDRATREKQPDHIHIVHFRGACIFDHIASPAGLGILTT